MTKSELNQLHNLLTKFYKERLDELNKEFPEGVYSERLDENVDVYTLSEQDPTTLWELDDGDRLSEGIDIVIGVVENIRGEDDKPTKPTLEEIKRVLQYLDEELMVEGTFEEVCEYVNQLKDDE